MMRGIGYGDESIERLQIGVVSSWGEINPAAIHLDRVVEAVKGYLVIYSRLAKSAEKGAALNYKGG
jgi:dihydroxyacid dehydratase/phosphogluconate dehydratase